MRDFVGVGADGVNLLHVSAFYNLSRVVEFLVDKCPQDFVDAIDTQGKDALWYVVRSRNSATDMSSSGASALSILAGMSANALKRSIKGRRGTDADGIFNKLSERTMIAESFFDILVKEIQQVETECNPRMQTHKSSRSLVLDPAKKHSNAQRKNQLLHQRQKLSQHARILATTKDHRGNYALCYLFRHSAPVQTVRFCMAEMQKVKRTLRNFRDRQGNSFLHLAVSIESQDSEQNSIKLIDLFQKQHLDIVNILRDEINAAGQTPLELAQQNKLGFELQGSLLHKVKNISRQDVLTRRDFYRFCRDATKTNDDVVKAAKRMVPASIDKPLEDEPYICDGRTVLHFAADFGRGVTVIDALINSVPQDDRQQFVERRDGREFTALDYATRKIEDGSGGETIISGVWNLQEEPQRRKVALRLIERMSQAAVLEHCCYRRGGEVLKALLDDFPENHHSTRDIIKIFYRPVGGY